MMEALIFGIAVAVGAAVTIILDLLFFYCLLILFDVLIALYIYFSYRWRKK